MISDTLHERGVCHGTLERRHILISSCIDGVHRRQSEPHEVSIDAPVMHIDNDASRDERTHSDTKYHQSSSKSFHTFDPTLIHSDDTKHDVQDYALSNNVQKPAIHGAVHQTATDGHGVGTRNGYVSSPNEKWSTISHISSSKTTSNSIATPLEFRFTLDLPKSKGKPTTDVATYLNWYPIESRDQNPTSDTVSDGYFNEKRIGGTDSSNFPLETKSNRIEATEGGYNSSYRPSARVHLVDFTQAHLVTIPGSSSAFESDDVALILGLSDRSVCLFSSSR